MSHRLRIGFPVAFLNLTLLTSNVFSFPFEKFLTSVEGTQIANQSTCDRAPSQSARTYRSWQLQCPQAISFNISSDKPLLVSHMSSTDAQPVIEQLTPISEATLPPGIDPHSYVEATVAPIEGAHLINFSPATLLVEPAFNFSSVDFSATISAYLQLTSTQQVSFDCNGLSSNPCASMNTTTPVSSFAGSFEVSGSDFLGFSGAAEELKVRATFQNGSATSNGIAVTSWRVEQFTDAHPGQSDELMSWLVAGNSLYMSIATNEDGHQEKLYKTDGTNIFQITNLSNVPQAPNHDDRIANLTKCPLPEGENSPTQLNVPVCFTAFSWPDTFLYRYNGEILERISDMSNHAQVSKIGETLFDGNSFYTSGYDSTMHRALFRIDPYEGGQVYKSFRLLVSANANRLVKSGPAVYFIAWPLTGFPFSYVRVIHNGVVKRLFDTSIGGDPAPENLSAFQDGAVFTAKDGEGDDRLYYYNHNTSQLTALAKTNPNGQQSARIVYVDGNAGIYFQAQNHQGFLKLFYFNGTEITQVMNMNPAGGENVSYFTPWGQDKFLFSGYYGSNGAHLYSYDREANVVKQLSATSSDGLDGPDVVVPSGNLVFMTLYNANIQQKLYVFNSAENYLAQVSNVNPTGSDDIYEIIEFKGDVYFNATNEEGIRKIYRVVTSEHSP